MSLSPIPRGVYPSVTDISPKALAEKGVRLVLADLDNTLVPYKVTEPPAEIWRGRGLPCSCCPTAAGPAGPSASRRS